MSRSLVSLASTLALVGLVGCGCASGSYAGDSAGPIVGWAENGASGYRMRWTRGDGDLVVVVEPDPDGDPPPAAAVAGEVNVDGEIYILVPGEDPGTLAARFGRALIVDKRSRALHVFDGDGHRVLLGIPRVTNLESMAHPLRMGCDSRGGAASRYAGEHVFFDRDGVDVGRVDFEPGTVFWPDSEAHWWTWKGVVFRHGGGEDEIELTRTPDGRWWREVVDLALSSDGRLAVLDLPKTVGMSVLRPQEPGLVVWYGTSGEPPGQVEIPWSLRVEHLAFAGPWILLSGFAFPAWLLDTRDGSLHPVETPMGGEKGKGISRVGLSSDGAELWALEPEAHVPLRFALP